MKTMLGPLSAPYVIELPFMMTKAEAVWRRPHAMGKNYMFDTEFKDVKVLAKYTHGPNLRNSNTPIATPADLADLSCLSGACLPIARASMRALGTGLVACFSDNLRWAQLRGDLFATAPGTAMIFVFIPVAGFFNAFLAPSQVPQTMSDFVIGQG